MIAWRKGGPDGPLQMSGNFCGRTLPATLLEGAAFFADPLALLRSHCRTPAGPQVRAQGVSRLRAMQGCRSRSAAARRYSFNDIRLTVDGADAPAFSWPSPKRGMGGASS
jgi:hypothetical protein